MNTGKMRRLQNEVAQAWAVAVKDVRVYYLTPPMIMFGLALPLFLFFSFSVKREIGPEQGMSRLLALTTFFTASSAGVIIIPMERRTGTYDRLLAAPMALITLLIGKTLVGAFFAAAVALVSLLVGLIWLHVDVANPPLLITTLVLASLTFSALGLVFASIPSRSVGNIMMPSTLIRWPLLFISGIFIPLSEMSPWARAVAYLSPLTYAQELMNRAVLGESLIAPWLSLTVLLLSGVVFLAAAAWMHQRSRRLGY